MPVYEYLCPTCKSRFDVLRPISRMNDETCCPECETRAEKQLSVFSAMIMGGDGAMLPMAGGGGCGCGGNCACGM